GPHQGHVVAVPAGNQVIALAADQLVVAQTAVDDQIDRASSEAGGVDGVNSRLAVDSQPVLSRDAAGNVDDRRQAGNINSRRAAADDDLIIRLGAVDDDAIALAVGHTTSRRPCEIEVNALQIGAGHVADGDGVYARAGGEEDLLRVSE